MEEKVVGVMSCSRKECENILCDTYIPEVGYLCSSCIEEFKELYSHNKMTNGEIIEALQTFISIPRMYRDTPNSLNDFFKQYTNE